MALTQDGRLLATGGMDRTVKVWSVGVGKVLRTLQQDSEVSAVAFTRDGKTLAAASLKSIKLWDVATLLGK
jgi:WD40 repeat protein